MEKKFNKTCPPQIIWKNDWKAVSGKILLVFNSVQLILIFAVYK